MLKTKMLLNLGLCRYQPLLSPDDGTGADGATEGDEGNQQTSSIDYDKLADIINKGTQSKENSILKSYFEQQGMSQEDINQAIKDFKTNKQTKAQEQTTTLTTLQQENEQLKAQIVKARVDDVAYKQALGLGIEANTIPYVTKLADLAKVTNEKGEIDENLITAALNKVLEDVPQLKSANQQNNKGFQQIGAGASGQKSSTDDALKAAFGLN
ncbi:hypothetical protein [uncultured Clostridium sp.]|uniref:hypothetical protein n=1 Tax=uncultured Clostridium sp. TaxID=59620 RepID=UPI0032179C4D